MDDFAEVDPGQGSIIERAGKPIALARTKDGTLHSVSGTCTHAGCTVEWNGGEQSWDCPCHGSRFSPTGTVLHGPAANPLASVDIEKLLSERPDHAEPRTT